MSRKKRQREGQKEAQKGARKKKRTGGRHEALHAISPPHAEPGTKRIGPRIGCFAHVGRRSLDRPKIWGGSLWLAAPRRPSETARRRRQENPSARPAFPGSSHLPAGSSSRKRPLFPLRDGAAAPLRRTLYQMRIVFNSTT